MFGLRSSALGLLFVSSLLGVVEGADSYCNQGSVCDGNVHEGAWCNESDVNCEKGCGGSWCMDMDKEMDMLPLPEEEKPAVSLRGTRELQSSMCGCSSCSSSVYNRDARGHRVRDRIEWVVANMGMSQSEACQMVCGDEFPEVCGSQCAPNQCMTGGGGGQCSDSPRQWYDSDGTTYNCAWYAQRGRCARYGNGYRNFGRTANEACCACGGGGNAPSPPSPTPPPPSPTPPSPSPPTGGNTMCGCSSCTSSVYNRDAGGHLVRERIEWVVANMGTSQNEACQMVCGDEFPDICGNQCASNQCNNGPSPPSPSPPSPSPPTGGGLPPKSFNEGLNAQLEASGKLPYLFDNKSRYNDNEIYIAVVGRVGSNSVWIDLSNNVAKPMSPSFNTLPGPPGGPPGDDRRFANIFSRLSTIPSSTIGLEEISACKMFISFKKPLFLHFFPNGAYAAPDLNNPSDPNKGIRFETVELTWANNGLWINTSRVDAYQYPMGLEVYGNNVGGSGQYKKVGELKSHNDIISLWPIRTSSRFQPCYVTAFYPEGDGIIKQPSKIPDFKEGGPNRDYFKSYIERIWNTYKSRPLRADFGDLGIWEGSVSPGSNVFTMSWRSGNGSPATGRIVGVPNTQEVIEAKGKLHAGSEADKNVQKMFAAAINRHAIDTSLPSSVVQEWGDRSKYFQNNPHNEYVSFFHGFDITHNSETYAFAYDDVFEQSSTIQATGPKKTRITIGGFSNVSG